MFTIQQGTRDVMIWCKTYDGRKVCVKVCDTALEARLWIDGAHRRG